LAPKRAAAKDPHCLRTQVRAHRGSFCLAKAFAVMLRCCEKFGLSRTLSTLQPQIFLAPCLTPKSLRQTCGKAFFGENLTGVVVYPYILSIDFLSAFYYESYIANPISLCAA